VTQTGAERSTQHDGGDGRERRLHVSSLRHLLTETDRFVVAAELVTSRGLITERSGKHVLALARELAENPRIDALSITDNPGGDAMLSPDTVGTDLVLRGQEVIIHLSCKDWNRNALQSRGWKLSSEGFHNVLALSGDYPIAGYQGVAAPVFDIDSVALLRMFEDMNDGRGVEPHRQRVPRERTQFFLGAVVTNHKRLEREVMPQYFKLRKKIENGARFVINQIGYDARKDDELLRWMRLHHLDVPVLANAFVLTPGVARTFNSGRIPGVVVTDELLAIAERAGESPDKGRSFFLDLAARQIVVAHGLGYRGAYIGGHLEAGEYVDLLERADALAHDDWQAIAREIRFSFPDEFYFFEPDEETGLASDVVNRVYLESRAARRTDLRVPLRYRVSRRMHDAVFDRGAPLRPAGAAFYGAVERGPRRIAKVLHLVEHANKAALFGCRDCGDCSLPDIAYLCPESQCAKNQRNGPCGGTRHGACEVGDKQCIWALAYERLKSYGEEESMLDGSVVIKDNELKGTSAWANSFLERDHHARAERGPGQEEGAS
jgi:methylenetetrahydrofolate reductase (NADPH)